MAMQMLVAFACSSAAYAIYLFISASFSSRRYAAKARTLNCEEPLVQKNRYPFGIDNVRRSLAADRAQLFPVDLIKRTIDNGAITYKYSLLGGTNIFTADEKNIQAILANNFADFDLGSGRCNTLFPLLGNGIFTQEGRQWEHSRAILRPQFARNQISDLELEERHLQHMMGALDLYIQSNGWTSEVDLQILFLRLTLDSATEFLFGESVDSQVRLQPGFKPTKRDALSSDFASAFDKSQMGLATRGRFGGMYWIVDNKAFRDSCKICHEFIDHFVQLALSKRAQEKDVGIDISISKEKYVFLTALARETQDPIELRSQLLNILLAGRDTTASHLGWLFHCLVRDPGRFKKLRDIIISHFGTYDHPSNLTFANLKGCRYLQFCNNETLRLYPVVPFNSRCANKDTTIPRGGGEDGNSPIFIRKGMCVEYSVHVMHHRKDIWGPDADEFCPERWENRRVGWEYLPFNGGPRICIGQQLALTEASYVTVRLVQRFDRIENLETDPVIRHNLTLTNCSGNGVKVSLHVA